MREPKPESPPSRTSATRAGAAGQSEPEPLSRRGFLLSSAAGLAAGAVAGCAPDAAAQPRPDAVPRGDSVLLKGGCVISLDSQVGDFERADVLIDGTRIAAVGPNLAAEAEIVDCTDMIVMPGFVDTHRHMWQGALRNILPNGLLSDYSRDITGAARSVFRPEDAHVGDLISALGAIDAGVTTILDWSHVGNSPAHSDAAIAGLREAGIRAVYAFGGGAPGDANRFPDDIRRLRTEHFSSTDQLLTLAMAAGTNPRDWAIAREVEAFVSVHIVGAWGVPREAMGEDVTYIHCTNLPAEAWRMIADTGGHVSIAGPIEMQMNHGVPPFQQALDHGIRPSLSVDVETEMPGELFTQMRTAFGLQRMLALEKQRNGAAPAPALLTVRDVIEFATIQGAKANQLDPRSERSRRARKPTSSCCATRQRAAGQQRLRRDRARHGHQQRRHGVHRGQGAQARGAARRRRSRAHQAARRAIARLRRRARRLAAHPVRWLPARPLRRDGSTPRPARDCARRTARSNRDSKGRAA